MSVEKLRDNSYWYVWLPLWLTASGLIFIPTHSIFSFYFGLALRDEPLRVVQTFLIATGRLYLAHLVLAALWELLSQAVAARVKAWGHFVVRVWPAVFLIATTITTGYFAMREAAPLAVGAYAAIQLLALGILLWFGVPHSPPPPRRVFLFCLLAVLALDLSTPARWEKSELPRTANAKINGNPATQNSFLLLSFDSLSDDLMADHWPALDHQNEIRFDEAYSVTNSTYLSWISILTGKYPYETKTESFFPAIEIVESETDVMFPKKLQWAGYRTVYMTDCANLSAMRPEFGFDETFQLDPGLLKCGGAAVESLFPVARLFALPASGGYFPRLDSECSQSRRNDVFFSQVRDKLQSLQGQAHPFLIAVHSCRTSPDLGISQRARKTVGDRILYERAQREASDVLAEILTTARANRNLWTIFFSDHGVRPAVNRLGRETLYHALGAPLTRYQYHVPLLLFPPTGERLLSRRYPFSVSLLDISPTILELARISPMRSSGTSLLPGIRFGKWTTVEPARTFILQSALPSEAVDYFRLRQEITFQADGRVRFTAAAELALLRGGSVAAFQSPFRWVWDPVTRRGRLFNDLSDPKNETDLAAQMPQRVADLQSEICRRYPVSYCAGNSILNRRMP